MAKDNLRSFRYSDEVAGILEGFKGNSLNDKFENLVLYCFWERPKIEKELESLRKRCADSDRQYREKQKLLFDLNSLLEEKKRIVSTLSRLESDIAKFEQRVSEHVTQADAAAPGGLKQDCVTGKERGGQRDMTDLYKLVLDSGGEEILKLAFPSRA